METIFAEQQSSKLQSALEGLKHPLPQVRSKYAKALREIADFEGLQALKEAFLAETNILCKIEMMRSVVALEQSLGLAETPEPALEGAKP